MLAIYLHLKESIITGNMVKTRYMTKADQRKKSKTKKKSNTENCTSQMQQLLSLCKPCSVHLTNETFSEFNGREKGK